MKRRYHLGRSTYGGFTLMEVVLSMTVTSILMLGMGSAILLSSTAIPKGNSGPSATIAAGNALDQLTADLAAAKTIIASSPTMIQFTVANRGGTPGDQTITYKWSGVAGTDLTKQINGGTATSIQVAVKDFNLDYFKKTISVTTKETTVATSPEQLLSSWTAYPSGSPTTLDFTIAASGSNNSTVGWAGEYFKLGMLPTDLSKLTFTKVKLWMKTIPGSTADPIVSIHRAQVAGNPDPQANSLGSPATISRSLLTATYAPVTIDLPPDNFITSTDREYVIVVKGPTATPTAHLKYLQLASGAPSDFFIMQWSNNSGGSWDPLKNKQNQTDVPFEIWGTYETPSTPVTTTTYHLQSVALTLTSGSAARARLDTTIATPNLPIVAGP